MNDTRKKVEDGLIGLVLLHGLETFRTIERAISVIPDDMVWSRPQNREIWRVFRELDERDELPKDDCALYVADVLDRRTYPGNESITFLERIGGQVRLAEIVDAFVPMSAAGATAQQLVDLHRQDLVADCLSSAATKAKKSWPWAVADELVAELKRLKELTPASGRRANDVLSELFSCLDVAEFEAPGAATWGISELDSKAPLAKGRLIVLGAMPGGGKTTLALQALHESEKAGARSAIISMEMRDLDLIGRFCAERRGDSYNDAMARPWSGEEKRQAMVIGQHMPLLFQGRKKISQICGLVEQLASQGFGLIAIDFFQLARSDNQKAQRFEELSRFATDLAGIAKDRHCCILVLAQLNGEGKKEIRDRSGQVTGQREPSGADLAGTGDLHNVADSVLFIVPRSTGAVGIKADKSRFSAPGEKWIECHVSDACFTSMSHHGAEMVKRTAAEARANGTAPVYDEEDLFA